MKQVKWTERITEAFIKLAMLSDDEAYIIRSRVKDTPVSIQSDYLCCSEATVHRKIKLLKLKYDEVQKEYPEIFPVRKKSAKETWLDHN